MVNFIEEEDIIQEAISKWNERAFESGASEYKEEFVIAELASDVVVIASRHLTLDGDAVPVIRIVNNPHGRYAFSVYVHDEDLCCPEIIDPTKSLRHTLSRIKEWVIGNVL